LHVSTCHVSKDTTNKNKIFGQLIIKQGNSLQTQQEHYINNFHCVTALIPRGQLFATLTLPITQVPKPKLERENLELYEFLQFSFPN
jgi:hypothetical protein